MVPDRRKYYLDRVPYKRRSSSYVSMGGKVRAIDSTIPTTAKRYGNYKNISSPGKSNNALMARKSLRAAGTSMDILNKPRRRAVIHNLNSSRKLQPSMRPSEELPVKRPLRRKRYKVSLLRLVPAGVAIVVLFSGAAIYVSTLRTNEKVVAQVNSSSNDEEGAPSEEDVDETALSDYSVGPNMPRLLTVDAINVRSRVMRISTLPSGRLAAPSNINDTGWYDGSGLPGSAGAVLLAGHVHGPTKPGIFKDLNKLKKGNVIKIERGDGKIFEYTVVKTEQQPADKVDMASALVPVTPGKGGLNIISCAGDLVKGSTNYADRIIVYAEQN